MLINVYRNPPTVIPGTRIIDAALQTARIPDPQNALRAWEVEGLYMPVPGRALGGIRVKLTDQKGFVTFCNQRDFEVMLGHGVPGQYCPWSGGTYVGPDDPEWFGFCCDDDDLADDLYDRELFLRAQTPDGSGLLTTAYSIERYVHLGQNTDCADVFVMCGDYDHETGEYPDRRFETVERRWMRSERTRVRWDRV
jgi:hypothetical protein